MAVAIAPAKSLEIVEPAKKRRLKWTCRYCGHTFSTWTRRGLRVTCRNPKCGRVQEGPAGIELMAERLGRLQPSRPAAATPVQVVAAKKRRVAIVKPAPRAAAGAANGTAKGSPPRAVPAAAPAKPPAAAPAPKIGLFDRIAFGVRG